MATIGVIDYGAGNLRNVYNAVKAVGAESRIVRDPGDLDGLATLILPGVGAFGDCLRQLENQGLIGPVRDWIEADRPYLGICLGYQILFESSEESPGVNGLGILPGKVVHFPMGDLKIPHMGWNKVEPTDPAHPLWDGLEGAPHAYFVHSYYPQPADDSLVGSTSEYGLRFASCVIRGNLAATQFHPERSQKVGLRILRNFLEKMAGEKTSPAEPAASEG